MTARRAWTLQRALLVIAMTALSLTGTRPAGADLPPLPEVIAGIQRQYDGMTDLRARFIQEISLNAMQRTDREEGTLYWKKPQRMLWDYDKPRVKKLIINHRQAWLYIPEDQAAYTQKTGALLKSQTAVRLFSGFSRLQEDFEIRFAQPSGKDREGNYLLLLTPKGRETGASDIVVTVDPERHLVIRCRFVDAYGNVTRLALTQIQTDRRLPDRLFRFEPPPGVDVLPLP